MMCRIPYSTLINRVFYLVFSILNLFSINSYAAETDVCKAVLANGVHDKFHTFSSSQQFQQAFNLVSSKEFENWSKAKDAAGSLGINVIDLFDASLGGHTNESNYGERRNKFLSIAQSTSMAKHGFNRKIEIISGSITGAFTRCIELTRSEVGFYSWIVPGRNLSTFVINAKNNQTGNANIYVNKISIFPEKGTGCDINPPIGTNTQTVSISCFKPAESTVQVSMQTDKGNLPGINVTGTQDALHELRQQVYDLVNSGALVPSNTIAFFTSQECNQGWEEFTEMRGRYVVALPYGGTLKKSVGKELTNGQNRATGSHVHGYTSTYFAHPNGWRNVSPGIDGEGLRTEWNGGTGVKRGSQSRTTSATGIGGTNAPYIQLLACRKI